MKRNIIFALVIICCGILYYVEAKENTSLRSEVLALQTKLSKKNVAEDNQRNILPKDVTDTLTDSATSAAPQIPSADLNRKIAPVVHHKERDAAKAVGGQIFADRQIEAVDHVISLSDTEESRLKDSLSSLFQSDEYKFSTDQEKNDRLKEALSAEVGEERADLYLGVQRDAETKAENDSRELASSMFTKRLILSADQEPRVSRIIQEVDRDLGSPSKMLKQKLQNLHSQGENGDQDPAQLMKQYVDMSKEIRDKRRSVLNEKLKGVLTRGQYNQLLSEQAASPDALWGLRGY